MFRVIVSFLSDDMAKVVLKSCETCNASTLLHTPADDVRPEAQPNLVLFQLWKEYKSIIRFNYQSIFL